MDEFEDDPGRPSKDKSTYVYGQVLFYAYVTLKAHRTLGINADVSEILAIVSLCRTSISSIGDADAS